MIKKHNLKKVSVALALSVFVASCSKSAMDKINQDRNNAADVPSRFILTDGILSSAFNVTGSDYAFYASVYTENNVGIFGQMNNAETRIGEPYSATTYNNTWGQAYSNIWGMKKVIEKCSPGGSEIGNYQNLGIAQIVTAYNLAVQTDLMGDIPWTEAGQPGVIFQPKLDKQQDIYSDIFKLLDNAIANLAKTSTYVPKVGVQDGLYGGSNALWTKFAYGLRARYKMRLSLKSPKYQEVIDDANKSFVSAAESATYKFNGTNSINPFFKFDDDRGYFASSQSLHDKLVARNDPRDDVFFTSSNSGPLVFAPNGNPVALQGKYGVSALLDPAAPIHMLSYHEILFLKAEASARLGKLGDAATALKAGIEEAFVKVGLTTAQADTYYTTSVVPLFTANALQEIMIQKYLAFHEDEAIESYNDIRRLKAMGNNFITLANPNPFPLRFTYGSSDVTTNPNVRNAYGDGQYVKTENVWWAGGTR